MICLATFTSARRPVPIPHSRTQYVPSKSLLQPRCIVSSQKLRGRQAKQDRRSEFRHCYDLRDWRADAKIASMGTHIVAPISMRMKTTVEISDVLLREARRVAVREGVTLRTLVERGLRRVIAETKNGSSFKLRRVTFKG